MPFDYGVNQYTATPWSYEEDVVHYAKAGIKVIEVCQEAGTRSASSSASITIFVGCQPDSAGEGIFRDRRPGSSAPLASCAPGCATTSTPWTVHSHPTSRRWPARSPTCSSSKRRGRQRHFAAVHEYLADEAGLTDLVLGVTVHHPP